MVDYLYFDREHAIKVHDEIIVRSGGVLGIINVGTLESTLEHIQNDIYYPALEDKATHLFYSINKNHSFNDGNKRSSIALTAYFFELNGYDFIVSRFIREMENIVIHVANNVIDKDLLRAIISSILCEEQYPEDLQIRIIEAIQ